MAGCEYVQKPLVCNLTAAFSDLRETYLTRIGAQLGGQVFRDPNEIGVPFKPIGECHGHERERLTPETPRLCYSQPSESSVCVSCVVSDFCRKPEPAAA